MKGFMRKNIFLFVTLIFISACEVAGFEVDNLEEPTFQYTELSLFDETAISEMQITYKVDDKLFTPEIIVRNEYLTNNNYSLIFILNYNQINVRYNGKEVERINMSLEPSEQKSFNIEVPIVDKGRHDFIAVLVQNPGSKTLSDHYIESMVQQMAKRVTLIAQEDLKPDYITKEAEIYDKELDTDFIYFTNSKKDGFNKNLNKLNPSQKEIFLNIPVYSNALDYTVLIFNNLKLEENYWISTKQGLNGVSIVLDNYKDINNTLFAIAVPNPYEVLESSPNTLEEIPFHTWESNRLALESFNTQR
ncbi:hypothetical protein ACLIA0_07175 [Bacillaceae bacterium W0354]